MRAMGALIASMRPGVWFRVAQRQSRCCAWDPEARDGVIVTVPAAATMRANPEFRDYILLIGVDDHGPQVINISMDREGGRALVNGLIEAIAESERRSGLANPSPLFND
jgi:hypothetical protein